MFKLYGNVAGWKKLDIATDERQIVSTMIDYSNKFNFYDYMIIQREQETDMIYKRIRNQEEFSSYLVEYKHRTLKPLEDMSCVDLKKYILKKKLGK